MPSLSQWSKVKKSSLNEWTEEVFCIVKKLLSYLFLLILFGSLAGCNQKIEDDTYNVFFFTANTGATKVESYFDVEANTLLVKPEDPERPGFDFAGWYQDLKTTLPWDFEVNTMPEQSIVLYAKWDVTERNIIYHLNGGTMTTEDYRTTFNPGESFVLPSAKRTGYSFKGWFLYDQIKENYPNTEGTKPGDVGISALSSTFIDDVDYFAHWATIIVAITFRSNHPLGLTAIANPPSKTMGYGTEVDFGVNFPADFGIIQGYQFIGWNSKKDGTGDWIYDGSIFTRTLPSTYYGQWQPVN